MVRSLSFGSYILDLSRKQYLNYLRILINIKLAKDKNLLAHYAKGTAVILNIELQQIVCTKF